ncbi:MAG TPA: response regulator [Pirellulales bacterium]
MSTKSLPPVHFLLVDDRPENLLALKALLRREGVVLLEANSGPAALELLLRHEVALALIDVQMPGMDGFELAELMRGTERTRRVPIIFVTAGNADRQRRFRGYETGAVDFIHKPIEPDVLRSKTGVFYELCRQRQEVAAQRDELIAATEENARLLEESRWQAEALKEADRRKDEFLAMLAHELRNPLAPVQNAVEILRLSESADPAVTHAREIISRQVSHMARLIDDLLDVARIARGKIALRPERLDLAAVIRQTVEDYRPSLSLAGLSLNLELPADPLILVGDLTRLAQVLGNLLHNAGKFTPGGGTVTVQAEVDAAAGQAVVAVRDTGAGLDAAVRSRLFEPFSQADQALARTTGGLGLGLALAKGLIELHGGSIAAESEGLGRGSTFTIRLPLATGRERARHQAADAVSNSPARSLRILIVEDNSDTAYSTQMLLALLGHEVDVAFDGDAGFAAARALHPDVVMSDLGLPGETDGFALARKLRADPALSNVHLIALSGYGQQEDRRRTHDAGFDQHLVKPVDFAALNEALLAVPARD